MYTHHDKISAVNGYAVGAKGNEVDVINASGVVTSSNTLNGSLAWNPGSIAIGAMEAIDITIAGAALGDFVLVSFSLDVLDLTLTAQVTAVNTVTAVLANNTAGAVDLVAGTVYARVLPK